MCVYAITPLSRTDETTYKGRDSTLKQNLEHRSQCVSNFSYSFSFFSWDTPGSSLFLTMFGKDEIFATVLLMLAHPTSNTSAAVCGSQGYKIVEIMMSLAHGKKKLPNRTNVFHCNMNKWQFPGCFESCSFFIIESFISIF